MSTLVSTLKTATRTYSGNEARENGTKGFQVDGGSDLNRFVENISNGNGVPNLGYGLFVSEVLDNIFIDNTADDNGLGPDNWEDLDLFVPS